MNDHISLTNKIYRYGKLNNTIINIMKKFWYVGSHVSKILVYLVPFWYIWDRPGSIGTILVHLFLYIHYGKYLVLRPLIYFF